MASPKAVLENVRAKAPPLDHLIRAFGRYTADAGNRQAAAVTYFGFLSLFPMLALAASVLGFVLGPKAIQTVIDQVNSFSGGLAEQLKLQDFLMSNSKAATAGVIGLVGLLYSGLGWVDALREAVRTIWHHNVQAGNIVVKKLKDVLVLAGLGVTILLSVAVSAVTGAFKNYFLDLIGLQDSAVASVLGSVVGYALGILTSLLVFLFLFWRLPKVGSPLSKVFRGAVLAALLFEVLKRLGTFYIARTTSNPVYGTFAVTIGLLVWINLASRLLLVSAAWTVTAPYDSDVPPSGTADPELAERAGIPVEFSDNDPDDPPTLQEDGAPSPLAAAIEGKVPSQDLPEGRDQSEGVSTRQASRAQGGQRLRPTQPTRTGDRQSAATAAGHGAATAVLDGPSDRATTLARQAGQFTAGAAGMAVVAIFLHVVRTLRQLLRR